MLKISPEYNALWYEIMEDFTDKHLFGYWHNMNMYLPNYLSLDACIYEFLPEGVLDG